MTSFTTNGHTAYHLRTATVSPDSTAIISACFDGAVLCHAPTGDLLWRADAGGHFPFDLAVGDIDGDGLDEVAVATAAGILYAFDHDGRPLWTFEQTAPLFQAAIARRSDGSLVILTGGVEHVLTAISPGGTVVVSLKTEHCIRHVRAGRLLDGGQREGIAITTASGGLSGRLSLFVVDPDTLEPVVSEDDLGTHAHDSGKRFFSMMLLDIDGDDRDEIVPSNSWGEHGKIFAFDADGQHLYTQSDERIANISYRMNLLHHIALPGDDYILGHFGNVLIRKGHHPYPGEGRTSLGFRHRRRHGQPALRPVHRPRHQRASLPVPVRRTSGNGLRPPRRLLGGRAAAGPRPVHVRLRRHPPALQLPAVQPARPRAHRPGGRCSRGSSLPNRRRALHR